jgi:hypothetical protein
VNLTNGSKLERPCSEPLEEIPRRPTVAQRAKQGEPKGCFCDESGFRAGAVDGKPGGECVAKRPSCIGPDASAIDSKVAFWCCTYHGGLNGELFVELLTQMMRYRKKPVPLIVRQPTKPPWSMYSLPELGVSSPCTSYLAMHRTSTQTSNVRGSSVLLHRSVCSLYSNY